MMPELIKKVTESGTISYTLPNGDLHREDGPAIEKSTGEKYWYQHGQLHREDGPAVEWANGGKMWYWENQCHREDGPAIISADHYEKWIHRGRIHREDGPAVVWDYGRIEWWLDDNRYHDMEDWATARGILGTDEFTMVKLEWG